MRTITLFFLLVCAVPLAQADTIATVNGTAISSEDLQQAIQEFAVSRGARPADLQQSPQFSQLRSALVNSLVERELLWQAAHEQYEADEAEVAQAVTGVRTQLGGQERFRRALQAQGMTEAMLETRLRRELSIQAYLQAEVYAEVEVSEADISAFYQANQERFRSPDLLRLRNILIPAAAQPDPRQFAAQLHQKLLKGADFPHLARKHSADSNARNGGELGFLNAEDLGPELAPVAQELAAGSISEPHAGPDGVHLLQLVDRRAGIQASLDQVHDRIRDLLLEARRNTALQKRLQALRQQAEVVIEP